MPRLTIDNCELDVPDGSTILDAAARAGIVIPTLCHLRGLPAMTSCFVCVVKVDGRENLLPACATVVRDGMSVDSQTPEVLTARRTCLELLMSDHLGDCLAPCEATCPAGMNIPVMLRHLAAGRIAEAHATAADTLVLPATLGRICPAPCEKLCRRSVRDQAVSIRQCHRVAADAQIGSGDLPAPANKPAHHMAASNGAPGGSVAIVGAGPAGLATAWHLLRMGYACTIFDDRDAPGGMLRSAIDETILPHDVLDAEIAPLRLMGCQFRQGTRVGRDVPLDSLRREFAAVVLAVGELAPGVADALGVKTSPSGIEVDPHSHQTSLPGVFAGGCAIRKQRLAVRSVADGAAIAAAIDQSLSGQTPTGAHRPFTCRIGRLKDGEIDKFMEGVNPSPRNEFPERHDPEIACGFADTIARDEAARCLHCDCRKADSCRLRDACDAYGVNSNRFKGERRTFEQDRSHVQVIYESGKCIACGLCVQIAADAKEKLGLAFIGRGFDVRVRVPFDRAIALGLERVAQQCIDACPTGALAKP